MRNQRRIAGALGLCVVGFCLFSYYADKTVRSAAYGRLYRDCVTVPACDVALVLGTSRTINRAPNPFYDARIDAAVELFRAGKIRGIVVSGDNPSKYYNEPRDMRNDLVARGIPAEFITCDFAGVRTRDSVQRINHVFGQTHFIVVSQQFHVERAVYIAQSAGLDAVGYVAADAPLLWWVRTRLREILARDLAVTDVFWGREPKYLGGPVAVVLAPRLPSDKTEASTPAAH